MLKSLEWTLQPVAPPWGSRLRRRIAPGLRRLGAGLAKMARRWAKAAPSSSAVTPVLEFYAEAGAPEGALFVDGQRVGVLEGVNRL